jgi:5'-3' exonuclease
MINILCDGNYVFHKTFGVFAGYGNVDPGKVLKSKSDQAMFIRKVATDLTASLKLLPAGGRLIFTADSRSWRKDVEIEDGGYKSGRVKDENVDWSIFFDLMHSFGTHLEKMGFVFSKVNGAEGDDLLLFWSQEFNKQGESAIIISGDNDLHQLVKMNGPDSWTCVWNSNSKKNVLYVPQGWKDNWLNEANRSEVSIFNMGSTISPEKERLKDFIKKVNIEEINSFPFVFNKILIGDKGDSVPSVWEYETGGKITRFTQSKADKLYELFQQSEFKHLEMKELSEDQDFLNWVSPLILKLSKGVDSSENRIKAKNNWLRNLKLMWLDTSVIPESVSFNSSLDIQRGLAIEKKTVTFDRIKILEGTEWITTNYQPKGFDPFENLLK